MRAAERCKVHFQGDKCRKSHNHHSPFTLNPDSVHMGIHSAWTGESYGGKKVVARSWKPIPKISRQMKRFIRGFCKKDFNVNLIPQAQRKNASQLLEFAAKLLRRQAIS